MSLSVVSDSFQTPQTIAQQAPLSMGFSRQEHWSGWPFPLQGIFPTQGSNLGFPHCRQSLYCLSHQGSPKETGIKKARREDNSHLEEGKWEGEEG